MATACSSAGCPSSARRRGTAWRGSLAGFAEGGYLACCPGVREVFQLSASSSGQDDERVGLELPLRVYACVEGHCGDGKCEDAEAVACGCPAGCPSAVWGAPQP